MIRYCTGFILFLIVFSCNSEKSSLSPLYSSESVKVEGTLPENLKIKNSELFYASELTNQVSSFPKFSNDAVNSEVSRLKNYTKNYVYALQEYNSRNRRDAFQKVEKSYVKLQKLRRFLNSDEDEVMNRYLVRIKSHIGHLEMANEKSEVATK